MSGRSEATRAFVAVSIALLVSADAGAVTVPPGTGPLVVIDPGHGGEKTGTKTVGGTQEKSIVLGVAEHVKRVLTKAGVRVVLTRESDQHVELDDRVGLANQIEAAVFISIHANYSPVSGRRGAETYILSPDASDNEAASVAELENDAGEEGAAEPAGFGGAPSSAGGDLDLILNDLARGAAHQDSARLARFVIDKLATVPALGPSRGLRQAPFKVLRGAKMPAALVELGYLSNAKQGELLQHESTQRASGEALAQGILGYLRNRGATAARQ